MKHRDVRFPEPRTAVGGAHGSGAGGRDELRAGPVARGRRRDGSVAQVAFSMAYALAGSVGVRRIVRRTHV